MGVWVTALVTLVVQSVLTGVGSATAHLRKAHLPAPGNDDVVDVDGIVAVPQDPLVDPQESSLIDEGFDQTFDVPDGKSRNASDTLIGDPGVFAKEIGFGEDGVQNDTFRAGNLDTAEDTL